MDSDTKYTEAKRLLIDQLKNSISAQNEGRYRDIGSEYEHLYDLLSDGRFSETISLQSVAHMKGGSENRERARTSLEHLYAYQKSLGQNYDKLFDALQFLNNWMDDSIHWSTADNEWVNRANRIIHLLEANQEIS